MDISMFREIFSYASIKIIDNKIDILYNDNNNFVHQFISDTNYNYLCGIVLFSKSIKIFRDKYGEHIEVSYPFVLNDDAPMAFNKLDEFKAIKTQDLLSIKPLKDSIINKLGEYINNDGDVDVYKIIRDSINNIDNSNIVKLGSLDSQKNIIELLNTIPEFDGIMFERLYPDSSFDGSISIYMPEDESYCIDLSGDSKNKIFKILTSCESAEIEVDINNNVMNIVLYT